MTFKPTRRQFIQRVSVLPWVGRFDAATETITRGYEAERLKALRSRRAELVMQGRRLEEAWLSVRKQLPWWCVPGPKYLTEHGNSTGPIVGWPATQANRINLGTGQILQRPSPLDLRQLLGLEAIELSRDAAASNYRNRVKQLRSRLRRRRAQELAFGMPRTADWWPIDAEIDAIDRLIAVMSADANVAHSSKSQVSRHLP